MAASDVMTQELLYKLQCVLSIIASYSSVLQGFVLIAYVCTLTTPVALPQVTLCLTLGHSLS